MDQEFSINILSNGLRVMLIPMKDNIGITYMEMALRCGFLSEQPETYEYAHFLEHMQAQFTSSKNRSSKDVGDELEAAGANVNASTWVNETRYYISCKEEDSQRFLKLMLTSFVDYKMDTSTFDAEADAVVTELLMRSGNDPWEGLKEKFTKYFYGKRRGTMKERIQSTKKATVEGLMAFRDRFYVPENMLLTISGGLTDVKAMMMLVENTVGKLPRSKAKPSTYFIASKNHGPICFYTENKAVASSYLSISWAIDLTPKDVDETNAGRALGWILTSGMRSRLMDRLRTELKAVYGISAMVEVVNFGQSSFSLETEVESKFIPLIIKEVLKQVVSLKKKLIGEAEFSRVKNKIIMANRLIPLSIEPERYATQYSYHVLWDEKVVTYQDKLSSFEKITPVDVQKFVENNLVRWDNLSIAYCGGQDCSEKIKKIIRGIRIV